MIYAAFPLALSTLEDNTAAEIHRKYLVGHVSPCSNARRSHDVVWCRQLHVLLDCNYLSRSEWCLVPVGCIHLRARGTYNRSRWSPCTHHHARECWSLVYCCLKGHQDVYSLHSWYHSLSLFSATRVPSTSCAISHSSYFSTGFTSRQQHTRWRTRASFTEPVICARDAITAQQALSTTRLIWGNVNIFAINLRSLPDL